MGEGERGCIGVQGRVREDPSRCVRVWGRIREEVCVRHRLERVQESAGLREEYKKCTRGAVQFREGV